MIENQKNSGPSNRQVSSISGDSNRKKNQIKYAILAFVACEGWLILVAFGIAFTAGHGELVPGGRVTLIRAGMLGAYTNIYYVYSYHGGYDSGKEYFLGAVTDIRVGDPLTLRVARFPKFVAVVGYEKRQLEFYYVMIAICFIMIIYGIIKYCRYCHSKADRGAVMVE